MYIILITVKKYFCSYSPTYRCGTKQQSYSCEGVEVDLRNIKTIFKKYIFRPIKLHFFTNPNPPQQMFSCVCPYTRVVDIITSTIYWWNSTMLRVYYPVIEPTVLGGWEGAQGKIQSHFPKYFLSYRYEISRASDIRSIFSV